MDGGQKVPAERESAGKSRTSVFKKKSRPQAGFLLRNYSLDE